MEESRGKPKEEIEVKELSDVDKDEIKKPDIDKPDKEKKPDIDKPDKEKKPDIDVSENIEVEKPQFKKIQVHEGKADITKKDPNIKTLNITASLEPEKKKKGGGILLE